MRDCVGESAQLRTTLPDGTVVNGGWERPAVDHPSVLTYSASPGALLVGRVGIDREMLQEDKDKEGEYETFATSQGNQQQAFESAMGPVRARAKMSVRPATGSVYEKSMAHFIVSYKSTAKLIGIPEEDHFMGKTQDQKFRNLVASRFVLHLFHNLHMRKDKINQSISAVRYYFACSGEAGDKNEMWTCDLTQRVRDSCTLTIDEARELAHKRAEKGGKKTAIPHEFTDILFLGFEQMISDPLLSVSR